MKTLADFRKRLLIAALDRAQYVRVCISEGRALRVENRATVIDVRPRHFSIQGRRASWCMDFGKANEWGFGRSRATCQRNGVSTTIEILE